MRQFQIAYENREVFRGELKKIASWRKSHPTSGALFQIFTGDVEEEIIREIEQVIDEEMPDADYYGCTTNGNILGDTLNMGQVVSCTLFEYPTSKYKVLQYEMTEDTEIVATAALLQTVRDNPWVKAVELLVTIRGMSMTGFTEHLSMLPENVQVFGGGAMSENLDSRHAKVFSKNGKISEKAVVFVVYGGEDIHITTTYVTGWKPLGREMVVTSAEGNTLYELDNKPAYDTYFRYLSIKNDEHFFNNTLEFPFFFQHNGIDMLRAPISSNEDGSIVMTSDMDEGCVARMAYGDPGVILDCVREEAEKIQDFQPEVIRIYSCAARRTFWGDEANLEFAPFQSITSTSGFFTSGEFLRTGKFVNQHNVTMVIGALREGNVKDNYVKTLTINDKRFSGQVSMIRRMATFVQAATEELEEANRQLEKAAITDGLTGLSNRKEIQKRITDTLRRSVNGGLLEKTAFPVSLIMIDIDDFKKVNDTYGHKEGDLVLRGLSDMVRRVLKKNAPGSSAGRWGGEEFMILLPERDANQAEKIAECMRKEFNKLVFSYSKQHSISLGVTQGRGEDDVDSICMRVDSALYDAKHAGKNCVVVK